MRTPNVPIVTAEPRELTEADVQRIVELAQGEAALLDQIAEARRDWDTGRLWDLAAKLAGISDPPEIA